jgi:hypothetical protein
MNERMNEREDPLAPPAADELEGELVDEGDPDTEPKLVGSMAGVDDDEADEESMLDVLEPEIPPAEEAAVHVRDRAPGATDDESDGYGDDAPPPD